MNDETVSLQPTVEENMPPCKPTSEESEETIVSAAPIGNASEEHQETIFCPAEERSVENVENADRMSEKDPANSALFANSVQNSDSDLGTAVAETPSNELDALREELKQLRKELSERDAFFTRLGGEYEEFKTLYPSIAPETISESIWNDVCRGIPLAAAYALSERRRQYAEEKAEKSNSENRFRSPGAINGGEPEYFTPAEVRAMSRQEVRNNYQKIMSSMKQWNRSKSSYH